MPARDHIESISARYRAGETLEQIGGSLGVTRERIRQLLKQAGLNSSEGGRAVRAALNHASRIESKAVKFFQKYGMSREQYRAINGGMSRPDMPITAYTQQMGNARYRGIAWHFTFATWWKVWSESGKWEQRGRGGDLYVMSRPGDEGPYAPDNVVIQTLRENSTEQFEWNRFGGKHFAGPHKEVSAEVLELLEMSKLPGVRPHAVERTVGFPRGTWSNIQKAKTVRANVYSAFRETFLRMSEAA